MSIPAIALVAATVLTILVGVAGSVALAARRGHGSLPILILLVPLPFLLWGTATAVAWVAARKTHVDFHVRDGLLAVGALALVGSAIVLVRGWRRTPGTEFRRGRSWRFSALLAAFAIGLVGVGASIGAVNRASLDDIAERRAQLVATRTALAASIPGGSSAGATYASVRERLEPGIARLDDIVASLPEDASARLEHFLPFNDADVGAFEPLVRETASALQALAAMAEDPSATFGSDLAAPDAFDTDADLRWIFDAARLASIAARVDAHHGDREGAVRRLLMVDQIAEDLAATPTTWHLLTAIGLRRLVTETIAAIASQIPVDDPPGTPDLGSRLFDRAFDDALVERARAACRFDLAACEWQLLEELARDLDASNGNRRPVSVPTRARYAVLRLWYLPTQLAGLDREKARLAMGELDAPALDEERDLDRAVLVRSARQNVRFAAQLARATSISADLRRAVVALRTTATSNGTDALLPRDPFGSGDERVRALRRDGAVILYSRGANGRDDGGQFGPGLDDLRYLVLQDVGR
ncbi:MAG: hypothetical protein JNM94_00475 [Phycisphaerae bacterium]|nr:hypothetical protein [Phycisphaerae bacterium]